MSKDWFDTAQEKLQDELIEIALDGDGPAEVANNIYSFLYEIGLIDYDVEKDVLYDRYIEGTEDQE